MSSLLVPVETDVLLQAVLVFRSAPKYNKCIQKPHKPAPELD